MWKHSVYINITNGSCGLQPLIRLKYLIQDFTSDCCVIWQPVSPQPHYDRYKLPESFHLESEQKFLNEHFTDIVCDEYWRGFVGPAKNGVRLWSCLFGSNPHVCLGLDAHVVSRSLIWLLKFTPVNNQRSPGCGYFVRERHWTLPVPSVSNQTNTLSP